VLSAALALLERAELTVESIEDAADMIRWALLMNLNITDCCGPLVKALIQQCSWG
jgi:hydroxymethylpyrimidine/phosphomethylpyrimidine kinase